MARDIVTADEMQRIATAVRNAADRIEDAVKTVQNNDPPVPQLLLHANTFLNQTMPRLIDWAVNVQMEARAQAEAFSLGVMSRAESDKVKNERRKARDSASKQATKKPKG